MDLPTSRPVKFTEEDPLPGSKDQLPRFDKDHLRTSDQTGLDMSRRIPFHVAILILEGNDLIQLHDDILNDGWIRIFIDRHASGGMRDKDDADSICHSCFFDSLLHRTCDINKL